MNSIALSGKEIEKWDDSKGNTKLSIENLRYSKNSNKLPIKGTVHIPYQRDVIVFVENYDSKTNKGNLLKSHIYSLPVKNGTFSGTILIPYHGPTFIEVGLPSRQNSFGFQQDSMVSGKFFNFHRSLPETQVALLQSWLVNYNESSQLKTMAQSIINKDSEKGKSKILIVDSEIKQVNNWVARNIKYNWPNYNQNNVEWIQATLTLNLKKGVCQDQSALAAALLRSIGIPTKVIGGYVIEDGEKVSHQWNASWDGEKWVLFDVTLSQVYKNTEEIKPPLHIEDKYFNLPPKEFNLSHQQTFDSPPW